MNKKLVLLSALALMGSGTLMAQKRVTGRILDTDGQPVYGAHVKVEGTDIVTATDAEGRFTLTNVPSSAKRVSVSYIGMQTQTVSISGNMNVVLEQNDRLLEEAVVVGYGTAKKIGSVTGAITKVDAEAVAGKPNLNVVDALQGQVSGLQIFNNSGDASNLQSFTMNIRGVGSLTASSTPLIIVDGSTAGTTAFSMMNSEDIESITVLKDASATAIYGSRAANGVIYITTKKGRRGEKARVRISQKIGWSQLANNVSDPMNSTELLDFQFENGIITPDEYVMYKKHGSNTDWQDYAFENAAPMYETNFSVEGGSESTTYFLSASYTKQAGVTQDSKMKRYTLRANIDSKLKDWLQVGVNQTIGYVDRKIESITSNGLFYTNNYAVLSYMSPAYWDPYDPEMQAQHMIWRGDGQGDYDIKWYNSQMPQNGNNISYNGTAYIQLTPVRGLTLRSQLGLYAVESRGTIKNLPTLPGIGSQAGVSESFDRWSQWTITNTAEYKFNIGTDHAFTLLAGQEGIKYTGGSFAVAAQGLTDNRLTELDNATTVSSLPSSGYDKYEYLSFFGRVDYALKDKYFANFTVRSDASSRFGSDNRTALFYSGGLLWNMKKEAFMEPVTWISALQLKASVGSTGNSELRGNYRHLGLIGTTPYMGNTGWYLTQPSNTQLGWEKQIQTNVGFNLSLWNKLHIDFSWYNRLTKDMLMSMPLPYTTGFSALMMNIGQLRNRGVELEVVWDAIRTEDAFMTVRVNYAYNKNQIVKLFNGISEWPMPDYWLSYIEGQSVNFYMPIYAGVDKEDGAPMWYLPGHSGEAGNTFNPETMTKTYSDDLYQDTGKSYYAPHTGGFGLAGGWKGLTISADFAFVLGKYMVNYDGWYNSNPAMADQKFNQNKSMLNVWKKPGDLTLVPSYEYEPQFDTHLLENASFLRLKNLTVSYDLPKAWMKATGLISNIRLSAQARNLFTITKYKGVDPELDSNAQLGSYPATRDYMLGIEVTF